MNRLQLLDYGRFFAAISVLFFHYFFKGIHNGKISSISHIPEVIQLAKYGYLGVYFFFMISGYVIFFSAKDKKAGEFAVLRLTRLYPAFWVSILFTSIFIVFWGGEKMNISPTQILANFTMVSPWFGQDFVDGVYWTLIYELSFYCLVFALLLFGIKNNLKNIFLVWPLLILIANYLNIGYIPWLHSYYSYFAAGTILAITKKEKTLLVFTSLLLSLVLCIYYSTGEAPGLTVSDGIIYSKYMIGTIIATFFLFFTILNTKIGSNLQLPNSRLIGNLTYPIYLIHAQFGYLFLSQFATEYNKITVYFATVFIVFLVAYSIHILIEKRYAKFWQALFYFIVGKPIEVISSKLLNC